MREQLAIEPSKVGVIGPEEHAPALCGCPPAEGVRGAVEDVGGEDLGGRGPSQGPDEIVKEFGSKPAAGGQGRGVALGILEHLVHGGKRPVAAAVEEDCLLKVEDSVCPEDDRGIHEAGPPVWGTRPPGRLRRRRAAAATVSQKRPRRRKAI